MFRFIKKFFTSRVLKRLNTSKYFTADPHYLYILVRKDGEYNVLALTDEQYEVAKSRGHRERVDWPPLWKSIV